MIRGSVRECAPRRIESTWNANIHNRFDIEVRDAKTNQLKQKARAFNVICKGLWSNLNIGYFDYIVYSDGTGTPSTNDTTTFGTIKGASAKNHSSGIDIESGVAYRTRKIVLDETTDNGMTITEVGISKRASAGHLCTHAMLEDMNGNPISITKTSSDILTIYATVYVHWTPSGQNGVTLAPPILTSLSYGKNFLDVALGHYFDTSSGEYSGSKSVCLWAGKGTLLASKMGSLGDNGTTVWNQSTKKLTYTFARAGVGKFNIDGGFGWLGFNNPSVNPSANFCVVDVRDEYEVLGEAVGTGDGSTTSFVTKFDMPANAKVYVNGVALTSGVTVKPHPVSTDATLYMVGIQDKLYDNKPCFATAAYSVPVGEIRYVYNPLHYLGIGKFASSTNSSYWKFAFSDDLVNWSPDYSTGTTIPEAYRYCKYARISHTYKNPMSMSYLSATFASESGVTSKNIIFDEAPAEGSVITIDYTTPFVPKDENHVYDLSITIQFGEYTE